MQINNQAVLSRAVAFFLIVFLSVDMFLEKRRPSEMKWLFPSFQLPPPPLLSAVKRHDVLLHHGDEQLESGAQAEIKPPPLLLSDAVASFACRTSVTILTEGVSHTWKLELHSFSVQLLVYFLRKSVREMFFSQGDLLICLPEQWWKQHHSAKGSRMNL